MESKKRSVSKLVCLILAFAMLFSLAAYASEGSDNLNSNVGDASAAVKGGSIAVGSTAPAFLGHFDGTQMAGTNISGVAKNLIYDSVFIMGVDGTYTSNILSDWYWSDEVENQLVLVLKDYVYFASGDQMTMEDVLWSLQRYAASPRGATNFAVVAFDDSYVSDDGLTLYLQYNTAYAPFYSGLAQCVLNKSFVEAMEEEGEVNWYSIEAVDGSGPYLVTESVTDVSMTFEKNPDWWEQAEIDESGEIEAYLDTITVYPYKDNTTMIADYYNGVIDVAINLTDSLCNEIGADPSLGTIGYVSSHSVDQIVISTKNPVLQNEKLREAICIGTDSSTIELVTRGSLGSSADSVLSSTQPYYEGGHAYTYDPELAKELVAESGETDLTFRFVINNDSISQSIADQFQYYMDQIGIKVEIEAYDQSTAMSEYWTKEDGTDFMINGAGMATASNEAADALTFYRGSFMYPCTAQTDETIVNLLEEGRTTLDPSGRARIYADVQQWFGDHFSIIPIGEWNGAYSYNGRIAYCDIRIIMDPSLRYIALGG